MNTCDLFAALLDSYVDGELSPEEAAHVRAHLEVCDGCRSYVDAALTIRAAFPEAESTPVPDGFAAGVAAAIRADAVPRKRPVPTWQKTLLPLAACLALLVLLRPIYQRPLQAPQERAAATAADSAADAGEAAPQLPYSRDASAADTSDTAMPEEATSPSLYAASPAEGASDEAAYNESASLPAAIWLTARQAETYLPDQPFVLEDGGVRRYELTWQAFNALLDALAGDGIVPETADPAAGWGLVYVME